MPLAAGTGGLWIYFAAFLGALGSFFSGSNTISNLTFGGIQISIAEDIGVSPTTILALQSAGGALGSMIAIHNIVAVCAVLGLKNQEGVILKKTIHPGPGLRSHTGGGDRHLTQCIFFLTAEPCRSSGQDDARKRSVVASFRLKNASYLLNRLRVGKSSVSGRHEDFGLRVFNWELLSGTTTSRFPIIECDGEAGCVMLKAPRNREYGERP